jgi:hypothetical protein
VRIGDAMVVEGESGRVEEIASTYIAVATWDQRTTPGTSARLWCRSATS